MKPPTLPHDWVRRYLDLLRIEHPTPGSAALARLTRAHVLTIPFENVTALLRRRAHPRGPVPPVDLDALLASWEARRGGGVCFELAAACGHLLERLGYRVHEALGAISFPGSHQALVVELGGARFLVDVGNGAPFLDPIPLDRTVEVHRAGLSYRFGPDLVPGGWLQERRIDGAWTPFCRYALGPPDPAARASAYQRHHTVGETWVLGSLTLIRSDEQEVVVLRDDELTRFTAERKRTERVRDDAAYRSLASEVFRLPALPVEAGLAAWRANAARSAPR